jgi:hypothetical protein
VSNVESDHAAAILALLRARPQLAGKVFDGRVPDPTPTPPYVVTHMHMERLSDAQGNALDGLSREATLRAICHCVGEDDDGARAMAYQVEVALLDVRPVIGTRNSGLIRQESSQPPSTDESTGTPVVSRVDTYRVTTQP